MSYILLISSYVVELVEINTLGCHRHGEIEDCYSILLLRFQPDFVFTCIYFLFDEGLDCSCTVEEFLNSGKWTFLEYTMFDLFPRFPLMMDE